VLTDFSIEKIKEISKPVNHFLLNIVLWKYMPIITTIQIIQG
jgi:hypothetical protein